MKEAKAETKPESSGQSPLAFRGATREDLTEIVRLLADDPLGSQRERYELPLPATYIRAFEAITADPNQELLVAEAGGRVVGVLQLTFIPNLTYQGSWRALIEGVRVSSAVRGRGVGRALMQWAVQRARARGCLLVQLTTDKARVDARRFYESLGFTATHEGMKLGLTRGE